MSDQKLYRGKTINIMSMSDNDLYRHCQEVGRNVRKWRNQFVALLPEVYKRRLYRRKSFCSIHEFAAKIGGLSHSMVDEVLRIDEKLKDKPKLKSLIPKIGISKLRTVACVAKKSTDKFWAEKVQKMTRKTLEIYIKDTKFPGESESRSVSLPLFDGGNGKSESQNLKLYVQDKSTFSMQLTDETIFNLRLLKQKLEKESKQTLCWDDVIKIAARKLLISEPKRQYKARPSKSRAVPARKKREPSKSRAISADKKQKRSESKPIAAKKKREQSKKCIVPGCNKPTEIIHHPDRYSITKNHNRLAPMCKAHHELAHLGHLDEESDFKTLIKPIIDPIKQLVDQKMLAYLKAS